MNITINTAGATRLDVGCDLSDISDAIRCAVHEGETVIITQDDEPAAVIAPVTLPAPEPAPEPQPTRDALLAFARSVADANPGEDDGPVSLGEDLAWLAEDAERLLAGAAQPDLSALSDDERSTLWGGPVYDSPALDQIAEWLRDPEWGAGMLEDIREMVNRTGRTCENYPDDRSTWGRH